MKYLVKNYMKKVNNTTTVGYAGTFLQKTLRYRMIPKRIDPLLPF